MKKERFFNTLLAAICLFTVQSSAHAQTVGEVCVEGTVDVSIASFDITVRRQQIGDKGSVYLDTSNIFVNDKEEPIDPLSMAVLSLCPKLNLGRFEATPQGEESNEDAVRRELNERIAAHATECLTNAALNVLLALL